MATKDKWVRRFSVDATAKHKNGFTIYKITSVLFPIDSPEAVTVVSVWKRYSDVQRLHKSMRTLHAGLHLRGNFPALNRYSFFKRFQQEVIEDRARTIKTLLEFIAEHRLLFTSTDLVDFLETGYSEPAVASTSRAGGVIDAIRSSLHLPIEDTPPLEYQTDDDDTRSPSHSAAPQTTDNAQSTMVEEAIRISNIPIYVAADVELRQPPKELSNANSYDSINSLASLNIDIYDEVNKLTIDKHKPCVKSKSVLPDLILFDAPNATDYDDDNLASSRNSESASLTSNVCGSTSSVYEDGHSASRLSLYSKKSVLSLSNLECKTKTEDSYVFEAGYMLNLAVRCENLGDYQRAFECYKSGIEKMLIGVQSDSDPQRRALIKEKTNKYLSYAETIYKNHLSDSGQGLLPEREETMPRYHCPLPLAMLKRSYEDLALYRVLAILSSSVMLVLYKEDQSCYAMKVVEKVPHNLTEFDEYFLQQAKETREPVLPTDVPYMVPLQAYIETTNLFFLILSYAPGEKLFDYIKNYKKSLPSTPAREVNLENVFAEPKMCLERNDKTDSITDNDSVETVNNNQNAKTELGDNSDLSVKELVRNSQKLLMNVDKVLSQVKEDFGVEKIGDDRREDDGYRDAAPVLNIAKEIGRDALPPRAVCRWGAEILTAVEGLHRCGVICRDLNPSNVLLGDRGQVILTYMMGYSGLDMALSKLRASNLLPLHIAPELYHCTIVDAERDTNVERACDFWSYGVIMYELLCGVPLSQYHRSIFTSHTILQMPEGLPIEVQSLLSQLLTFDPSERLGAGKDGIEEIKQHPYFKQIDWKCVYNSWVGPG